MTVDKYTVGIRKKIFIINSDRRTLNARILKIAHTLRKGGYNVEILTWDRVCDAKTSEYVDGIKVRNLRLKLPNGRFWVLLFYFFWWFYVIIYLAANNADGYHPLNLYNLLPVIPIRFLKKVKIIYDMTDFTADSFNTRGWIRDIFGKLENYCLKTTDGLIIVDDHRLLQVNTNNVKQMEIVMNSPDDMAEKFKSIDKYSVFTVYYGGWISETRGIMEICEAVSQINDIELVVAGFGNAESRYKKLYKGYKNINFIGLLSKEESLVQTYKADLVFAFYDPKIPINRLASPNKLFDAMMCGTPIISNSEALPVAEIINMEQCGFLVPYSDIKEIKKTILKLKSNNGLGLEMGNNGRRAFESKYNWSFMEERLLYLYEKVFFEKDECSPSE